MPDSISSCSIHWWNKHNLNLLSVILFDQHIFTINAREQWEFNETVLNWSFSISSMHAITGHFIIKTTSNQNNTLAAPFLMTPKISRDRCTFKIQCFLSVIQFLPSLFSSILLANKQIHLIANTIDWISHLCYSMKFEMASYCTLE